MKAPPGGRHATPVDHAGIRERRFVEPGGRQTPRAHGPLAPTDNDSLGKSGIKVFVMPSTGHFPMLEDPPRFNRSLDSVVKRFQQ